MSWPELACITSTGTLYGWIRWRSGSTAPAAVSHAGYNLALHAISGALLLCKAGGYVTRRRRLSLCQKWIAPEMCSVYPWNVDRLVNSLKYFTPRLAFRAGNITLAAKPNALTL